LSMQLDPGLGASGETHRSPRLGAPARSRLPRASQTWCWASFTLASSLSFRWGPTTRKEEPKVIRSTSRARCVMVQSPALQAAYGDPIAGARDDAW